MHVPSKSIGKGRNIPSWRTLGVDHSIEEKPMIKKSLLVAGTMFFAASALAQSGTSPGKSGNAPGQQMHNSNTQSTAPGASEYAPGHKMQDAKKSGAPGASEYAPGHQTTTGSSRTNTRK
jgi:hypothetical protein